MRYANEIKVGAVFLAGILAIILGYFFLRGMGVGAELYYLKLDGAAQIAQGNDVRLQGVKIGQVQEVGFDLADQRPILTLAVRRSRPPFRLLTTYQYSVQNAGIIGENYVDIRGEYLASAPVFEPNNPDQIIPGRAAAGLLSITQGAEDIVIQLRSTLDRFNTTLDRINEGVLSSQNQRQLAITLEELSRLSANAADAVGPEGIKIGLGDPQAQRDLNATLANIEAATGSATVSSRNVERASRSIERAAVNVEGASREVRVFSGEARRELGGALRENRPQLRALLGNFDRAAQNVADITETLEFALRAGGFGESASGAFASLARAAANIEAATTGLRAFGEDPETLGGVSASLVALRQSTEALRDSALAIRALTGEDARGVNRLSSSLDSLDLAARNLAEGTAGLRNVLGDERFQDDLRASAANLNATLDATRGAAERVNVLLGGRRSILSAPLRPGVRGDAFAPDDGFSLSLRRYLSPVSGESGQSFGDLEFRSRLFDAPLRAGLSSVGDGTDLTVQSGQYLGRDAILRYGLYRSQLGAGFELRRGRAALEGNVWGLNEGAFNLFAGYDLAPSLQIQLGAESRRGDSSATLGLRVRP